MAKKSFAFALSLAAVALPNAPAMAATTVTQDLSTGRVGGLGTLDGNWTIGGPGVATLNPFISSAIPGTWVGGTSQGGTGNTLSSFDAASPNAARWISPFANGNTNAAGGSTFTYSTAFTLPNISNVISALLSVAFWADNRVTDVRLNGTSIFTRNLPPVGDPTDFTPTGKVTINQSTGFVTGTNTLQFFVRNGGTSANPAGFRAEAFSTVTSVPEPGTWMLLLLGFGAIGFSMRFRRKDQARVQFA